MPSPFFLITLSFLFAKTTLLAIVIGTTFLGNIPALFYHPPAWPFGYDSSSTILVPEDPTYIGRIVSGLLRWDAVYFISLAGRGVYIWEQEWAFGPGWPVLIRHAIPFLRPCLPLSLGPKQITVLSSIIFSNAFHFFALIPLFYLIRSLFPLKPSLATVTCILHAFSPAGAFLLSGNTESLFNFLSFTGMALFHKGHRLVPALIWSLAGTVRSNALLWTGFFAWDTLNAIMSINRRNIISTTRMVIYLGLCGIISLGGFAWWQYSAWEQYCMSSTPEAWCSNPLPLIYSHVQSKYWDVGFLRYWTPGQLPNFLIASPHIILSVFTLSNHIRTKRSIYSFLSDPFTPHVLALTVMSGLLFTAMHVQIATRVLTAFPALYCYVAEKVVDDLGGVWVERRRSWKGGIRAIVVFGCVGAVLYSAFLPPA